MIASPVVESPAVEDAAVEPTQAEAVPVEDAAVESATEVAPAGDDTDPPADATAADVAEAAAPDVAEDTGAETAADAAAGEALEAEPAAETEAEPAPGAVEVEGVETSADEPAPTTADEHEPAEPEQVAADADDAEDPAPVEVPLDDAAEPDTTDPDAAEPDTDEPDTTEPDATEPDDAIDEETRERPAVPPTDAVIDEDPSDIDDATRERPVVPAEAAPSALSGFAAWTKRAATVTGERIGTATRQAATVIRERTAEAKERAAVARQAASERAEAAREARAERAEAARVAEEERLQAEQLQERERAEAERLDQEAREADRQLARIEASAALEEPLEFDIIPAVDAAEFVLAVSGLTKRFGDKVAVDHVNLRVPPGAFYGIVGPNGAGKTTTLSMITGLLRPDAGTVIVHGADVWSDPVVAKRNMGVLPDRLRLFDRLTGNQLLFYAGVLRGLDAPTVKRRTADLARAFGLDEALPRLVSDYSAGMTKKIALAAAMIHSPRLLVLDEPFESVDPVSSATVTSILKQYVAAGGTVLLSSHSMDLVQRICDNVAVVVNGEILADGTMDEVREGRSLEERFVELAGGRTSVEGLEWLHSFSD